MRVVYVYSDGPAEWNSANWRCAIPARALRQTRRHAGEMCDINHFKFKTQVADYHCRDADTIVVQRHLLPDAWDAVAYWRQRGKTLLIDIDDGYPQLMPDNPAYGYWHLGHATGPDGRPMQLNPPPIAHYWEGARKFHGVTSPNRHIVADAEKEGVKAAYIPNWPDTTVYTRFERKAHERYRIIWGGSMSHVAGWLQSGALYALARVITARPQVELAFCGADLRVLNSLPIKPSQIVHIPWTAYDDWPGVLATADLGIAPMGGTPASDIYDGRRSWIKPLEFSLMRLPWLASHSPAYDEYEAYGTFVHNSPDNWAQALAAAIDGQPDEDKIRKAHKWAVSQDISLHVDEMCREYARLGNV